MSERLVVPRAAVAEEIVEAGAETVEEDIRLRPETTEGLVVCEPILRMENWNKARFNKGKIEFFQGDFSVVFSGNERKILCFGQISKTQNS